MKRCNRCNLEFKNEFNFCKKCGYALEYIETEEDIKEKEHAKQINKERNQKIIKYTRYILGAIIILGNIIYMKRFRLYNIIGILFGISLLPVIYNFIFKKNIGDNKISKSKILAIVLPILLCSIWCILSPSEELEKINIKDNNHIIAVNEKYNIDFDTNLKEYNIEDFNYFSSDSSIANIENGVITGLKEGKVTITIKGKNSVEKKAEYAIRFIDIDEIKIYGDSEIAVGTTADLKIETKPKVVSDKIIKWESSDEEIISVDNDGKMVANKKGKVIITAYSEKGKKAIIDINVFIPVDKLEIISNVSKVEVGKTINLKLNIFPNEASDTNIKWSSSNNAIASVDSKGIVTGIKEGNVTITAASSNGIKNEIKIEVFEIKPESITLNKSSLSLNVGSTFKLTSNILPKNASNKDITWSSSSPYIASVENGTITAKSTGEATITAKTSNGKTATVKVTVTKKSPIKINNFRYTIDSVCGVEWTFSITNNSGKIINYITIKWYNFNAVGDFVYDQINHVNYTKLKYTGPLKPGKNSGSRRNMSKFYSCSYKTSAFSDIKIEYADGTTETITTSDMSYLTNLY